MVRPPPPPSALFDFVKAFLDATEAPALPDSPAAVQQLLQLWLHPWTAWACFAFAVLSVTIAQVGRKPQHHVTYFVREKKNNLAPVVANEEEEVDPKQLIEVLCVRVGMDVSMCMHVDGLVREPLGP